MADTNVASLIFENYSDFKNFIFFVTYKINKLKRITDIFCSSKKLEKKKKITL